MSGCFIHLSARAWREIAAMNAQVYKMTDAEEKRWYDEHPIESFSDDECDCNDIPRQ